MLSILAFQLRRLRDVWLGREASLMKRLQRQGRVVYGQGTYGVPTLHTFAYDSTRLLVGNYSSIGGNYLLGGQHSIEHVTTYPLRINLGLDGAGQDGMPVPRGDIVVGSDVWTGYGSWILGGVTIGDGAVVATGAVVTKDVPAFAVVGGVPAKVIKYRHTEAQREALLEIKWWDWSPEEVRAAVPLLADPDIDAFISYARSRNDRS